MASLLLTLFLCSAGSLLTDLLLGRFDLLFAYLLRPGFHVNLVLDIKQFRREPFLLDHFLLVIHTSHPLPSSSVTFLHRQTGDRYLSLGDSLLCALSTACSILSPLAQHCGPPQGDLQTEKGDNISWGGWRGGGGRCG